MSSVSSSPRFPPRPAGGVGGAAGAPPTSPDPGETSFSRPARAPPGQDDDDPHLAPGASRRFIEAFFAVIPANSTAMPRATILECHSDLPGDTWDPRWRELYCNPLFATFMHWVGARVVLEATGNPSDTSFSASTSLGALIPRLERQFERLLREELARFWAEASDSRLIGSKLRTSHNLALMGTLSASIVFVDLQQARTDSAKAFLRQAIALWRRLGVPGEDPTEPQPRTADDFLINQQWIDCFWICCSSDNWQAFNAKGAPIMDAAREFPSAPLNVPFSMLSAIPSLLQRSADLPTPPALARATPLYRCRDFLGIMDPHREPPIPTDLRAVILDAAIARMGETGVTQIVMLLTAALARILRFTAWLREEARISMLELLIAEDLISRGVPPEPRSFDLPRSAPFPRSRLEEVLRNPLLPEPMRQRAFLLDLAAAMEAAVPPPLLAAIRTSDFAAFTEAVPPDLTRAQQLQLIGYVSQIWLTFMLLESPEPFESWAGQGHSEELAADEVPEPSSPQSPSSDDTSFSSADELLELWFTTGSFFDASRHAIIVSGNLRMILRSFQPHELGNNLFTITACFSAVYASWFHLLVLRRFRSLVARASPSDQAKALALHADIMEDVQACLNMLDGSGKDQYQAVRRLLQSILDGDSVRLSRSDLQMLRTARQARFGCPHADSVEGDGQCYLCAMESAKRGEAGHGTEQGAADPLADMPVYDMLGLESGTDSDSETAAPRATARPGRGSPELAYKRATVVRFSDEVTVHETYSNDEYPARSMLAPDHPDDVVPEEGEARAEANPVLGLMLQQRGLKT
ncbi:hypothetical protein DFJ74DRAFT_705651 [Hyaloraphidium curvatum]|nr:hypothetical protein DFJ74DRAFT_705651 [Hyaloraphidium curvatum]